MIWHRIACIGTGHNTGGTIVPTGYPSPRFNIRTFPWAPLDYIVSMLRVGSTLEPSVRPGMKTRCRVWIYGRDPNGYGRMAMKMPNGKSRTFIVSRFVLGLKLGRYPDFNELATHLCDNPACFNPDHIAKGSYITNAREMVSRGRYRGGMHFGARYKTPRPQDAKVQQLLDLFFGKDGVGGKIRNNDYRRYNGYNAGPKKVKWNYTTLAKRFGLSVSAVNAIVKGRSYIHLDRPKYAVYQPRKQSQLEWLQRYHPERRLDLSYFTDLHIINVPTHERRKVGRQARERHRSIRNKLRRKSSCTSWPWMTMEEAIDVMRQRCVVRPPPNASFATPCLLWMSTAGRPMTTNTLKILDHQGKDRHVSMTNVAAWIAGLGKEPGTYFFKQICRRKSCLQVRHFGSWPYWLIQPQRELLVYSRIGSPASSLNC